MEEEEGGGGEVGGGRGVGGEVGGRGGGGEVGKRRGGGRKEQGGGGRGGAGGGGGLGYMFTLLNVLLMFLPQHPHALFSATRRVSGFSPPMEAVNKQNIIHIHIYGNNGTLV